MRRKTEGLLQDLKRKLDEEQNKRTKEMNNNQQHNDKIIILEKQVFYIIKNILFIFTKLNVIHNNLDD